MHKRQSLLIGIAAAAAMPFVLGTALQAAEPAKAPKAAEGINVGVGEQGIAGVIVPGPPITANDFMSKKHRDFPKGMTCAECHDVTFNAVDSVASATRQMARSDMQLSQEQIWAKIVEFLPGRERFALTTAIDNKPLATTVDMVLDKEEKVLYVVSEVGTEKLLQIRRNPNISAVHFAGWTLAEGGPKLWRSTQVNGTAEVIPSSDPRFSVAVEKYNLVRVTKERSVRRFDLIRIQPEQIWYFDTTLGEGYAVYQQWKRGRTGVIAD
jgi:nitroimidazol reductase NimA-like FMN-containing flavoprotein (pyridoxamine 5'-phosphate oxidase superfamily)